MTKGVRFKDVAQELTNLGYPVTPTNGKKAFLRGWAGGHPPEQVAELIEKHPDCGAGVLTGRPKGLSVKSPVAGLDVDVLDPEAATEIRAMIREIAPQAIYRVGQDPKSLVPFTYSGDEFDRKLKSTTYVDQDGNKHAIELLTTGQQFVAYGHHDGAGKDYEWFDAEDKPCPGIREIPPENLPVFTMETWNQLVARFDELAIARGWTAERGASRPRTTAATTRVEPAGAELDAEILATRTASNIPVQHLVDHALAAIVATYQDWAERIVAPLKYEFKDSPEIGVQVADYISSRKPGYEGFEDVQKKFNDFDRSQFEGDIVKGATILHDGKAAVRNLEFDEDQPEAVVRVYAGLHEDERRRLRNGVAKRLKLDPQEMEVQVDEILAAEADAKADALEAELTRIEGDGARREAAARVNALRTEAALHEMSSTTALVVNGDRNIYLHRPKPGAGYLRLSRQSATEMLNNLRVAVPHRRDPVPLFSVWMKWPERRTYTGGLAFEPNGCSPDRFNLYTPNDITPRKPEGKALEAVEMFNDYLLTVVCAGNREHFRYLRRWMAWIYQHPGGPRAGVAFVMLGEQGTGKGTFVKHFGRLFQPHVYEEQNQRHFSNGFNHQFEGSILVFCDEAVFPGDKAAISALKGLITENTLTVNRKHVAPYKVSNHANLIIASNNAEVFPAGPNERRAFVVRVSDCRCQDKAYFAELERRMVEDGGYEALAWSLQHEDTAGFLEESAPRTQELATQFEMAAEPEIRFLIKELNDRTLGTMRNDGTLCIEKQSLYARYKWFCTEHGVKRHDTDNVFFRKLKTLIPLEDTRVSINGKRERAYTAPPIEECREHFISKVGHRIEWQDDLTIVWANMPLEALRKLPSRYDLDRVPPEALKALEERNLACRVETFDIEFPENEDDDVIISPGRDLSVKEVEQFLVEHTHEMDLTDMLG